MISVYKVFDKLCYKNLDIAEIQNVFISMVITHLSENMINQDNVILIMSHTHCTYPTVNF